MANASRQTVAVDGDSVTGKDITSVSSTTLSVTVASNPNRMLVVCFGDSSSVKLSSASRNGNAFTQAIESSETDGSAGSVWYLEKPAVGTADVTFTFSGTSTARAYGGAISLYNVDQDDPVDITDDTTNSGDSITSSFTPTENNCVAVDAMYTNSSSAGTGGETEIFKRSSGRSGGCQYETGVNAVAETMAWTGFSAGDASNSAAVAVFQGALPGGAGFLLGMV